MTTHWTPFSYLVINLARQIRPGERTFSGVNSNLPMLACLLAKRAYNFYYTFLNVAGGIDPEPAIIPHSSSDPAIVVGSPAVFDQEDFYDLSCRGGLDMVYLGCAQIDGLGRTNVSTIGPWHNPKVKLPGGGGAAVLMPTANRVTTWRTEHSKRALVDKLDFVTAAGNLQTLVTPIAVFQKRNGRLALESWNAQVSLSEVVDRTGFEFDAAHAVETEPAAPEELEALLSLDPDGAFASEVRV